MKKTNAVIAAITLAALSALYAQAPTPAQPLQPTAQTRTALVAAQLLNQANSIARVAQFLDTGIPAQGSNPAISAADLKTELGADNVAKITAAAAALKGGSGAKAEKPKR